MPQKISYSLAKNIRFIKNATSNTDDLIIDRMVICGKRAAIVRYESLADVRSIDEFIVKRLAEYNGKKTKDVSNTVFTALSAFDPKRVCDISALLNLAMSGFAVILTEASCMAVAVPVQGYDFRAVAEPATEENIRSSREGFVEPIRVNVGMVRRRLKSRELVVEYMKIGSVSNTDVCLIFLKNRVSPKILSEVRKRLEKIEIDMVLESGFIQPFLESRPLSVFSGIGHTERPDTLCGKLREGRVAILVDGTPFALIVPWLFSENFQSFDDYTHRPYYATMIRILKYTAFVISVFLPGTYIAVANFNPEMLPPEILYNIIEAQQSTPFPLFIEAIFIHLLYEIVREAGLRLPRPVGHTVSLIGALVVGDTAVKAGLVGSPMVMILALTAISSYAIPTLYESITVLRIAFIVIGGFFGALGVALGTAMVLVNMSAVNTFGIPFGSPISPFEKDVILRDGIVRAGWRKLAKRHTRIQNMNGSEM